MASKNNRVRVGQVILFKRAQSPFWQMKYSVGKRELKSGQAAGLLVSKYEVVSTKQTTLRKAQLMAQEVDLKLFRETMGVSSGHLVLADMYDMFLAFQEQDTNNRHWHIRHLRGRIGYFVTWANTKGLRKTTAISLDVAELFVRHLRHDRGLGERTIWNYVSAIGSMFAWGMCRKPPLVVENPFAIGRQGGLRVSLDSHKTTEERYETYTPEHVRSLVQRANSAGDLQIAQLIVVLVETGMRFGELQFLQPNDIDWPSGRIHIRTKTICAPLHPEQQKLLDRQGRWLPKDETNRFIVMTPTCYRVMEQLAPPGTKQSWVLEDSEGLPIQDQGTRERLQKHAKAIGIMPTRPTRGKHASKPWSKANWRMFRNYFVSRAASAGMSLMHVMEATGHDSFAMVQHYFRLNDDAYAKDFKKYDSGLTGVDLGSPGLTRQKNTQRTQCKTKPLKNNDLESERGGFEPPVQSPAHWFSKPAPSAARAPLQSQADGPENLDPSPSPQPIGRGPPRRTLRRQAITSGTEEST